MVMGLLCSAVGVGEVLRGPYTWLSPSLAPWRRAEVVINKPCLSLSSPEKQPPVPGLGGTVHEGGRSPEPQGVRDHGHLRRVPSAAVALRELRQRGRG